MLHRGGFEGGNFAYNNYRCIAGTISVRHQREKLERHQRLLKVISIEWFLAHHAFPLKGHGDERDSSFLQLLKLRGDDDPRVEIWLEGRWTNAYQ